MMLTRLFACALIVTLGSASSGAAPPFKFEDEVSLADMQTFVRQTVHVGAPRDAVRRLFVRQGGATLKVHPRRAGVEKYLYDINLCSYYVWRWNISADFDAGGKLKQLYVNGEPALVDGAAAEAAPPPSPSQKAMIVKITRPRPEAYKGESSLAALIMDRDGDLGTTDDQDLMGGGPTRADPLNLGTLHAYHVEPWRSIFDRDAADRIVPYAGDCAAADAAAAKAQH